MSRLFYARLAADNMKKNSRMYLPYLLTCVASVMMYDILYSLSDNEELDALPGGDNMRVILALGCVAIAIFSTIFLIYTNSFLMKQRNKELGLFNILGMGKRHIAKVLLYETLYVAVVSLTVGIVGALLMSKLVYLLLLAIMKTQIQWGFHFSIKAMSGTIMLFGCIFLFILAVNLGRIHLSSPIGLLMGDRTGEKEPRAKWLMAAVGLAALVSGYYLSVTTENPGMAIFAFFVAVILVMIGTYCLFTAGSIVFLKLLRRRKSFYYQTRHFISISGMMYRMKQNAAGLASICILSTAVLVMMSSTLSLYMGIEDIMIKRFQKDTVTVVLEDPSAMGEAVEQTVERVSKEQEVILKDKEEYRDSLISIYAGLLFLGIFLGSLFTMATALMIYYKQVSEGYDDRERFEIMQKVGLSRKDIKRSVHSQILFLFFLPLGTAMVHIFFAFPVITRLLSAMNFSNVRLFGWCTAGTILAFSVVYVAVYVMTSRVYYRIVSEE